MIYTYLKDPTTRRILEQLAGDIRCFRDLESLMQGISDDPSPVVVTGGDFEKDELIRIIKRIRKKSPSARIIVVTTSGQEFDRENILRSGANVVFTKPYSPKLLVESLKI